MADICSLVSFYVATRANLDLLRALDGEAAEPSGFEALVTLGEKDAASATPGEKDTASVTPGEKNALARIDGALWATPERGAEGKRLWEGDFEVARGELVVLHGANGSGKSRLLDFLRGLSDAADLDGAAALSPDALEAAYLTYPVPVVPGTLKDNLLSGAVDPEVAALLDQGDLPGCAISDQPLNLSLGERQKLGLLRALSRPAPVVPLDEPLDNLDAATSAGLCAYLIRLKGRRTVVAVMHSGDLDAAADAVYAIRDGRLVRTR